MSIKSELSVLKVNIQNAKDKLYSNLVDKGVKDITTASTLDAMADSVSDIVTGTSSGGGNSFEVIGYSKTPKNVQDDIDYSITIQDNWDKSITNCNGKFKGNKQLVYFPLVDTSNVTNMKSMFSGCTNLQSVPQINTSNVTDMSNMFDSCGYLTSLEINSFDTSNVTTMSYMFSYCDSLTSLDISGWDTRNVNNMSYMFNTCSGITDLDISGWDTRKVNNMSYMFSGNNRYLCNKFNNIILPENFGSACTNMSNIFASNSGFTSLDLSNINTSNVTNMSGMFSACGKLTSLDVSNINTSNVTNMSNMFSACVNLTSLDLSNFNTSNVTNMSSIFQDCSGLTSIDLSSFDTSNVTNMSGMFSACGKLTKVDGYISFKSYSSSTMNNSYFLGYSSNSSLRKITFKDIGYHSNAKQFSLSYATNWGVNNDTITDAKQSLVDSLITYSFDRATNSYSTCTVTLAANTKAVLTDDEIAQITAKGFTIA